ncbi:unnamed protein product [Chironomus riparius]|uniref:Sm domain-containing protein n=1 Tax=Chironomus riparius TaxID=315576 RepID=A0A9N9RWR1_9DIPT|nr:unnamed protein product [Chironomus riparius]
MFLTEDIQQINSEKLSQIEQNQAKDSNGRNKLKSWLNRNFRIEMIDGRKLIGLFLCTDRDANVILGMCSEFRSLDSEARNLGLVIIKKCAIKKIEVDVFNQGEIL